MGSNATRRASTPTKRGADCSAGNIPAERELPYFFS